MPTFTTHYVNRILVVTLLAGSLAGKQLTVKKVNNVVTYWFTDSEMIIHNRITKENQVVGGMLVEYLPILAYGLA